MSIISILTSKNNPDKRNLFIVLALFVVSAAIFLVYPRIDILVSSWFFEDGKFYLRHHILFATIHDSVRYLAISLVAFFSISLILKYTSKANLINLTKKQIIYLFLALSLGPGLVNNAVLKDNWGRARPAQISYFSGDKIFSPPLIMTDQCERNCSFVSGDPGVGFHFFAWAFVFAGRRRLFNNIALLAGGTLGAVRVIQGAHFFSDVIFSGLVTFLVSYIIYKIMFNKEQN